MYKHTESYSKFGVQLSRDFDNYFMEIKKIIQKIT